MPQKPRKQLNDPVQKKHKGTTRPATSTPGRQMYITEEVCISRSSQIRQPNPANHSKYRQLSLMRTRSAESEALMIGVTAAMKGIRADGVPQAAAAVRQIQIYNSGACFCQDMWSNFCITRYSAHRWVLRTVSLVNDDDGDNSETSRSPGCNPCGTRVQNMEHTRCTHWLMFCAVLDVVRLVDGAPKSGAVGAGSGGLMRCKETCCRGVSARDGLFSAAIIKSRTFCS
jgi:hypothetical protein